MSNNVQHQFKDRYMLRLPDGMRDRIKAAAEANNRSMNAEIVATLEDKYPDPFSFTALVNLLRALERLGPAETQMPEYSEAVKKLTEEFLNLYGGRAQAALDEMRGKKVE